MWAVGEGVCCLDGLHLLALCPPGRLVSLHCLLPLSLLPHATAFLRTSTHKLIVRECYNFPSAPDPCDRKGTIAC